MTGIHEIIFYKTKPKLLELIYEYLGEGIEKSEKIVYLTTQNDANIVLEKLKENHRSSNVIKLFSHYTLPDPMNDLEYFEEKLGKILQNVINEGFRGRIAFNVLEDVTRFSLEVVAKIENAEKYLETIKNNSMKMLCTYKMGEKNEIRRKMLQIGLKTHDQVIFEKEDGSYSQITIEDIKQIV
jgi:hypothetical protein